MAETNSLLNCRTGNCTGGSNPPLSAKKGKNLSVQVYLSKQVFLFFVQDAIGSLWGLRRNPPLSPSHPPVGSSPPLRSVDYCFAIFLSRLTARTIIFIKSDKDLAQSKNLLYLCRRKGFINQIIQLTSLLAG